MQSTTLPDASQENTHWTSAFLCSLKAKFHYASLFGAGLKLVGAKFHYTSWFGAGSGSELAPNRFGVGSELVRS